MAEKKEVYRLTLNRAFIVAVFGEEFAQKAFARPDIRWNGELNGVTVQVSLYMDNGDAVAVFDREEAVEIFGWEVIARQVLGEYILPWPFVKLNDALVQLSKMPGSGKSYNEKERIRVTVIPD